MTSTTKAVTVYRDADGWVSRCTESDEGGPILGRIAMDEPLDAGTRAGAVAEAAAFWGVGPAEVSVS